MKIMAFISRHTPTAAQSELAKARGFSLVHVGDVDAFGRMAVKAMVTAVRKQHGAGVAFAVVNPAMAMNIFAMEANGAVTIGVFENANRAVEGGKPTFEATALHLWEAFQDTSFGVFVR